MLIEQWKDIDGFKGYYQVSNLGRIKSLKRTRSNGKSIQNVRQRIIKIKNDVGGYSMCSLSKKNKVSSKIIHRLVAQAFIPNPDNKPQINHIDGNKHNNNVSNLEWCTSKENKKHALETGLCNPKKINKKVLMLSLDDEPLLWFDSMTKASKETNTKISSISRCCHNKQKYSKGYKWEFYNEFS